MWMSFLTIIFSALLSAMFSFFTISLKIKHSNGVFEEQTKNNIRQYLIESFFKLFKYLDIAYILAVTKRNNYMLGSGLGGDDDLTNDEKLFYENTANLEAIQYIITISLNSNKYTTGITNKEFTDKLEDIISFVNSDNFNQNNYTQKINTLKNISIKILKELE